MEKSATPARDVASKPTQALEKQVLVLQQQITDLQAERHAMVRALGGAGTRLLKDTAHSGEDRWGAARRVTEAYVMHVFPELPLLAHALLTERARAAAEKVGGKSPR